MNDYSEVSDRWNDNLEQQDTSVMNDYSDVRLLKVIGFLTGLKVCSRALHTNNRDAS